MDDNNKHGVRAEIGLQLSEATPVIIQSTQSYIIQDKLASIVSASSGRYADITSCCTDNYKIRENIKRKHEPLKTTHNVNACSHQIESVDGHLTTGPQTVGYEHLQQEITEQAGILSIENSNQETTSAHGDSELI